MNDFQYVVRSWILQFDEKKGSREAQLPIPDPSDVDRCANMNFDERKAEYEKLKNEISKIEKAKEKVVNESDEEHLEPFQKKMIAFLEHATKSLDELNELIEDCAQKFQKTMIFYKFQPKDGPLSEVQPKDFFTIWHPFCDDFKNLWKREQAKIEKELLIQERLKLQSKAKSMRSFKTIPIRPNGLKARFLARKKKANE